MSRYVNFWSCDGCEGEGRWEAAIWRVRTEYGTEALCERHVTAYDPDHQLRIGAILEDAVKSWPAPPSEKVSP